MKKIELKFGERVLNGKFGVGFLGRYLKSTGQSIQEMFTEFEANPFYVTPNLMLSSFKYADPTLEITLEEIEDLIDDNGGINCPQMMTFIEAFTQSIQVDLPGDVGKSKKAKPKT